MDATVLFLINCLNQNPTPENVDELLEYIRYKQSSYSLKDLKFYYQTIINLVIQHRILSKADEMSVLYIEKVIETYFDVMDKDDLIYKKLKILNEEYKLAKKTIDKLMGNDEDNKWW